jgi:hypothetical protein
MLKEEALLAIFLLFLLAKRLQEGITFNKTLQEGSKREASSVHTIPESWWASGIWVQNILSLWGDACYCLARLHELQLLETNANAPWNSRPQTEAFCYAQWISSFASALSEDEPSNIAAPPEWARATARLQH